MVIRNKSWILLPGRRKVVYRQTRPRTGPEFSSHFPEQILDFPHISLNKRTTPGSARMVTEGGNDPERQLNAVSEIQSLQDIHPSHSNLVQNPSNAVVPFTNFDSNSYQLDEL